MSEIKFDMKSMTRRLENVERQNRKLKLVGILALVVFGATLFMGLRFQRPVSNLKATSFSLVDNKGKVLAALAPYKTDGLFGFLDGKGKPIIQIGVVAGVPKFVMYGEKNAMIVMSLTKDGRPGIKVYDKEGNTRFALVAEGSGATIKPPPSAMALVDEKGETKWQVSPGP